jgi:hypothetical protein
MWGEFIFVVSIKLQISWGAKELYIMCLSNFLFSVADSKEFV